MMMRIINVTLRYIVTEDSSKNQYTVREEDNKLF